MVLYSTVLYGTVPYCIVLYGTVQYLYWLLLDLSNIYPFTGGDSSKSTLFTCIYFTFSWFDHFIFFVLKKFGHLFSDFTYFLLLHFISEWLPLLPFTACTVFCCVILWSFIFSSLNFFFIFLFFFNILLVIFLNKMTSRASPIEWMHF